MRQFIIKQSATQRSNKQFFKNDTLKQESRSVHTQFNDTFIKTGITEPNQVNYFK